MTTKKTIKMIQKKIDIEKKTNGQCHWFKFVDPCRKWEVELDEKEFMELAEAMNAEYCRIRRRVELPVDIPVKYLKNGIYFISLALYQDLKYSKNPSPEKKDEKSLDDLLRNKGNRKDVETIYQLSLKQKKYGIAETIKIILDENKPTY